MYGQRTAQTSCCIHGHSAKRFSSFEGRAGTSGHDPQKPLPGSIVCAVTTSTVIAGSRARCRTLFSAPSGSSHVPCGARHSSVFPRYAVDRSVPVAV